MQFKVSLVFELFTILSFHQMVNYKHLLSNSLSVSILLVLATILLLNTYVASS